MSSLQSLREFISERLAAAAEEIFRHCEGTIVQYEEELCRQQRLLDIVWKPQLQLHHIDLPQHYQTNKEAKSCVEKEEQEEPEPTQTKDEQELQEPLQIKEEEQEDPEPSHIKGEEKELCISQDDEQLDLMQKTDNSMETPTHEKNEHSEADLNNQQSFDATDSQEEEGSRHEVSTSTDGETDQQNRDWRKRRDRSYVQNVDSSYMSESQCDNDLEEMSEKQVCEKTSQRNSLMKTRERKRKVQECFCEECRRCFTTAESLRRHMRIHTGEKPFSCKVCSKRFSQNGHLTSHMLIHTGEKPFSCKVCSKSFWYRNELNRHFLIHTGEKPFSCKECHKTFRRRSHLEYHILTHTGEKPFSCRKCSKSFRQSGALARHMVTHTSEKLFSCKQCNDRFRYRYELKDHMPIHTG